MGACGLSLATISRAEAIPAWHEAGVAGSSALFVRRAVVFLLGVPSTCARNHISYFDSWTLRVPSDELCAAIRKEEHEGHQVPSSLYECMLAPTNVRLCDPRALDVNDMLTV